MDYATFRAKLLQVLAEEDRLPGPAHRNLSEVLDDHGFPAPPDPEWLHHALSDFLEDGIIQLESFALTHTPGEPVLYALTLRGMEQAQAGTAAG